MSKWIHFHLYHTAITKNKNKNNKWSNLILVQQHINYYCYYLYLQCLFDNRRTLEYTYADFLGTADDDYLNPTTFARHWSEGLGTGKYSAGHSGFCSSSLQINTRK